MFRGVKLAVFGVAAIALVGGVTMQLWNWLMPALFGAPAVTFWQALGLLVLGRILFGGMRGGGPRMHWRRRMMDRWEQMTPEEREHFRKGLRCGPYRQGDGAPQSA